MTPHLIPYAELGASHALTICLFLAIIAKFAIKPAKYKFDKVSIFLHKNQQLYYNTSQKNGFKNQ